MTEIDLRRGDLKLCTQLQNFLILMPKRWFILAITQKASTASGQLGAHVLACCAWMWSQPMTDNELKLKRTQIEAVVVVGVIALVVFLIIAVVAFYYIDKWKLAGCL